MTRDLNEVRTAVKAKTDTKYYRWNTDRDVWEFLLPWGEWRDSVDLRKMDQEGGRKILREVGKTVIPFARSRDVQ